MGIGGKIKYKCWTKRNYKHRFSIYIKNICQIPSTPLKHTFNWKSCLYDTNIEKKLKFLEKFHCPNDKRVQTYIHYKMIIIEIRNFEDETPWSSHEKNVITILYIWILHIFEKV